MGPGTSIGDASQLAEGSLVLLGARVALQVRAGSQLLVEVVKESARHY